MAPLQLPDETNLAQAVVNGEVVSAEITPAPADLLQQKAQAERAKKLRRYNWLLVYIPVLLFALFAGILLGLLGWTALSQSNSIEVGQASGVADVTLTLFVLLPLTIVGAVLPLAGIGALYWRYTKGSLLRKPLIAVARKGEAGLATAETKLNQQQPRIVDGTIKIRQRIDQIINLIYSSISSAFTWIDSKIRPDSAEKDETL